MSPLEQTLNRALSQLSLAPREAEWVFQTVSRRAVPGGDLSPSIAFNVGALDELAKYAPLADHERSPQNRRGGEPPFNCRCDISPIE